MSEFNERLAEAIKAQKSTLKPCPFCGGEAVLFQYPENTEEEMKHHPKWKWRNPGMWIIGCDNDECIGDYCHTGMIFESEESAVKAWNRRAY